MAPKKGTKSKRKRPLAEQPKAKKGSDVEKQEPKDEEQKQQLEEELLKLGKLGPLQGIEELKEKRTEEQRKKEAEAKDVDDDFKIAKKTGVIYLGHIPHGFYEAQMKGFFSQFGTVANLRLSRSKKTGRSKGYAFIQFESEEVAKIVQKTMHKYILCDKVLECSYVEPEKVHERMFFNDNKRQKVVPWRKIDMIKHNSERTKEKKKQRAVKLVRLESKKRKKLKNLGIDYDFPGYKRDVEKTTV
mmetsp:Transcript_8912/g.10190  ORF Transcript_8912/g.10190 Transcript_8912/m.10190 type:complete len:244 (-) Transcript_8912:1215-1946(-)|eukprot:CAMPEP_0184013776 /NCGR_PEP_ID=MMETSP0954-20121128/5219_1 /TAXON_ID=627963 /ORGANISM="Aplanochytrium sp, Strain PBS07" /LENGTH=243 /DNA_ID=CAMNT_0026294039 /DNA_START=135 /DNA_END=866 /DNA_ORIENTATION=-